MEFDDFTVEQYTLALEALSVEGKLTARRLKMLNIHYSQEGRDLTASQMAFYMGWTGFGTANLHYGKLGSLFVPYLGKAPARYDDGRPMNFSLLASWWHDGHQYHWTMRPALAQALEELGLIEALPDEQSQPEFGEVPPQTYLEGAVRQVTVNAYERNQAARQACIDYHGTYCQVCESDLVELYGPIAQGFIHVHHIRPLSEIGASYIVNPINDLVPVCPNCHAMLHRTDPPLTVDQLRTLIQEAHP